MREPFPVAAGWGRIPPPNVLALPRFRYLLRSTATGIRTPVSAVRGRRPSPLDDGGLGVGDSRGSAVDLLRRGRQPALGSLDRMLDTPRRLWPRRPLASRGSSYSWPSSTAPIAGLPRTTARFRTSGDSSARVSPRSRIGSRTPRTRAVRADRRRSHRRRAGAGRTAEALAAGMVLLGANVTTQVLKPLLANPRGTYGDYVVGVEAFPSGHATAAMSLALVAVVVVPRRLRPLVATHRSRLRAVGRVRRSSRSTGISRATSRAGISSPPLGASPCWRRSAGANAEHAARRSARSRRTGGSRRRPCSSRSSWSAGSRSNGCRG